MKKTILTCAAALALCLASAAENAPATPTHDTPAAASQAASQPATWRDTLMRVKGLAATTGILRVLSDRELRGRHRWTLYRYTHGLASPDVYSETLKPVLGVTLILDTPDGTVLWHGVASVGHASLDTPAFTPGQLRDDPDRLRAGWVVAADVVMARLAQKYRAGIRDRREGYAD